MNISLLVAVKNNLEYTKHLYKTTREIYPDVELCFSSYGSTDGTHEWLEDIQSKDPNVRCWWSDLYGTFSDNFNKAASLATKDYIIFLHNDIVLAPNFIENIIKHSNPNTIVSYTTIEPPIFAGHERPGKIIKDFGVELETFNIKETYSFISEKYIECKDKIEPGITFFMCMPREKFIEIGGLDNLFDPCFCEDDDLILRWKLLDFNLITSLDAICYHFVSKTSRFSEENKNRTKNIEEQSNRNFVRKWGFRQSISNKKYNVCYVIKNCTLQILAALEPWCDNIVIDDEKGVLKTAYMELEQTYTKFNLDNKIQVIGYYKPDNDIIVEFDAEKLNQQSFGMLIQLNEIISESGEIGDFELDIFNIKIKSLNTYEDKLIFITNNGYG